MKRPLSLIVQLSKKMYRTMHIESFLDSALLFTFGVDQIDCVPGLRHQVMPTRR